MFNLAPGGRATVDRSEALTGINLKTGETRNFANSVEAAEFIGIAKPGNVRRVALGENKSAGGWWFKLADSDALPPGIWGRASMVAAQSVAVLAVRLSDRAEMRFASHQEAAEAIGAARANISRATRQPNGGTCNGYWLTGADSGVAMPDRVGRAGSVYKNGRPVIATSVATGEERRFLSGREAAAVLGVSDKNMPGALKGRLKTLGGWRFRYAEPDGG